MKAKYLISCDWLQVYTWGVVGEGSFKGLLHTYRVVDRDVVTKQFEHTYDVYVADIVYATINTCPRTPVIPRQSVLVKIANRVLYSQQYVSILRDILQVLSLKYKGLTRLDLCYDCNYLTHGRSVPKFIKQYLSSTTGDGHLVKIGASKFTLNGSKSLSGEMRVNGLKWGSLASRVTSYMYNKTQEMLEVKDKPWIRAAWAAAGLVEEFDKTSIDAMSPDVRSSMIDRHGLSQYIKTPVWRFEISIKNAGSSIVNQETGELFKIDLSYLEMQSRINALFYTYASKYFDFRQSAGQKLVKHYPRLKIFEDYEQPDNRPLYVSDKADTGRTELICANRLSQLSKVYHTNSQDLEKALADSIFFLRGLSSVKRSEIKLARYVDYLNSISAHRFADDVYKDYLQRVADTHLACKDAITRASEADFEEYCRWADGDVQPDSCSALDP